MTNRRDFLVKVTMAAGAISILEPLNLFATTGARTSLAAGKNILTILHTANIQSQWPDVEMSARSAAAGVWQQVANKFEDLKKEKQSLLVIDAGNLPGLLKENGIDLIGNDKPSATEAGTLPYSIIKKGRNQIGVIDAGTTALKSSGNTPLLSATAALNHTAQWLRKFKDCTLIICIVQCPQKKCLKLAGLSRGVDVVVSATEIASLYNTKIVRNKQNQEVILSFAGGKTLMMGRIDLTFNEKGEKINLASEAIFAGGGEESYANLLKMCRVYKA